MSTQSELTERFMCERLIQFAKEFYSDPANMEAFKKWEKEEEKRKKEAAEQQKRSSRPVKN